jgi:hypothetical protein
MSPCDQLLSQGGDHGSLELVRQGVGRPRPTATLILMSEAGRSKASITSDLGCSIAMVDLAREHYREGGPRV